jgi:hypothetical protein
MEKAKWPLAILAASSLSAEIREEIFGDEKAAEYEMVQHWPLETAVW